MIIEFDVVGSKEPELNQYAYKITGRDEEWTRIGNKSFLILENGFGLSLNTLKNTLKMVIKY